MKPASAIKIHPLNSEKTHLIVVRGAQAVYGFTLAMTGWWLRGHGGDPVCLSQTVRQEVIADHLSPTAIVMPIFNEDVGRVFRGLRVMYESLQATGQSQSFHFFILSDSSDPNHWIAEEKAWFELCRHLNGFGRIFYRKRRDALHHKSGNIADFCRRWGVNYRYMIVLDADSIMTGAAFVRLASLMDTNPQVGIIQTNTQPVLGRSLFQRFNQFASHVYGPLFVAGANFWQLDNANYYGHNAIIRLRPFIKHCAMPELPESGALGRRILSHDTVEAAFMRRAGYDVWSDLCGPRFSAAGQSGDASSARTTRVPPGGNASPRIGVTRCSRCHSGGACQPVVHLNFGIARTMATGLSKVQFQCRCRSPAQLCRLSRKHRLRPHQITSCKHG